jgi:hypothetical protein
VDETDPVAPVKNRTTRTDEVADVGVVDQGYHWPTPSLPTDLAPTLLRADPAVVSFKGDEWMVLRGSNFEPEMAVRFNGADAAERMLVSSSVLVARPPAMAREALTLELRNPGPDGVLDTGDDLVATLGGFTSGDTDAPVWPGPVGVQDAVDLAECDPAVGVTWEAAEDLDSPPVTYDIHRTDQNPFSYLFIPNDSTLVIDGVTTAWWVDTNVTKNIPYWYIVQARDSSEDPRRELNFILSTKDGTEPTDNAGDVDAPPPVGNNLELSTPDFGATVELQWIPVYPALKYRIYRSWEANQVVDPANEIGLLEDQAASSFTDDMVSGDEFLYYLVTTEDACGNESS